MILSACGSSSSDPTDGSSTTVAPTTVATTTTSTTSSTTTTTDPGFVQAEGEIFLEPVGTPGPESFTGELFAEPGTTTTSTTSTSTTAPPASSGPTEVSSAFGDTPALYGGSRDRAVCDMEGQLRFLEQNPDKAAAFVAAINSDPNLRWSGGTSVTVAQLPDYWAELTPMVLTRDTRVTNHGYRNGRPTSRQSVLQAGTAVLVDAYGVPRVRCECGNPLAPPRPVPTTPVYTGPVWPDFSPDTIIVINQTTVIIEQFILDIATGEEFVRPVGSDGTADTAQLAWMWQIDVEASEPDEGFEMDVVWSGGFTIAEDNTISGAGEGTWVLDADCTVDGTGGWIADLAADGSFSVTVTGEVANTEVGRGANIQLAYSDIEISSESWTSRDADCEDGFYSNIGLRVEGSIAPIEGVVVESEPVYASYQNEYFAGSVTLTPVQ